ncbi:MAG: hypothetical protein ACK4MY_01270 [Brevundimonas sp.]
MTDASYAFDALLAQRDAAYWAGVAAIAAWVGVVTSSIALGLVWQQLRANAAALKASTKSADAAANAARIAFQQSRPWIKLSLTSRNSSVYFTPAHDGIYQNPQISIPIRYENVGQTPALGHLVITRGVRDPHLNNGAELRAVWKEILATDWHPQEAVFPGDGQDVGYGTSLPWPADLPSASFAVLVVALYKNAIDEPWHGTPLIVWLHGPQPTGTPVRGIDGSRVPVLLSTGGGHGTYPT